MKKSASSSQNCSFKAGKIIRAIMLCKGITITQLARKLGITHSYLSLLIHNKKKNSYYRQKILEELNLPPSFWDNPFQIDFNSIVQNGQDTNVTSEKILQENQNEEL